MSTLIRLADGTEIVDVIHSVRRESDGYCSTCYMEYDVSELIFRVKEGEDIIVRESFNSTSILSAGALMRLFGNYYSVIETLDRFEFDELIYELYQVSEHVSDNCEYKEDSYKDGLYVNKKISYADFMEIAKGILI